MYSKFLFQLCLVLFFLQLPTLSADPPISFPVTSDISDDLDEVSLHMVFDGQPESAAEQWHNEFSKKLHNLMGSSRPPTDYKVTVVETTQLSDHTRLTVALSAARHHTLPLYLLVPKTTNDSSLRPGVLAVHGHGDFGHHTVAGRDDLEGVAAAIEKANYDYGRQFVRRGYVVAVPCMIPFGQRVDKNSYGGNDPCAVTFVRMQALGKIVITENVRDLRWAISYLQSQPFVDKERIGCAGLSYGGRMTMMVSAIDQRIKVAAVSGALNLMQERVSLRYSCGAQIIPNLLKYGDYAEIGGLIAPRPCVWEMGSTDALIVPKWDDIFKSRLERVYKALGAREQLYYDHFEGGHRWNGEVAFKLFDEVLKN